MSPTNDGPGDDLAKRVDKVEAKVEILEQKVNGVEKTLVVHEMKIEDHRLQIARIMSHIESEVGLARDDIKRTEESVKKIGQATSDQIKALSVTLFDDGKDEYGGRIGQINKRQHRFEVFFGAVIASAAILGFVFGAYYFITSVNK